MPGKDSCSKAVCGLVAFCAVVILVVLINQNMNTSGSSFCSSGSVSAARSSNLDAPTQMFKTGSGRQNQPQKLAGTDEFLEAPRRRTQQGFAQNESELIQNYEWDDNSVPLTQKQQLSLPGQGDYKQKVINSTNTRLLKEAIHNNKNYSRSLGSKSSMLELHEKTGSNVGRTLSTSAMPSWGLSDAYMSELGQ